jgi:tetratricopeptide (TPR) repeat protein
MSVMLRLCAACAALLAARPALADPVDQIGKRLGAYDSEVTTISKTIHRPSEIGAVPGRGRDVPTRRTIDAQVNFGIGNYDEAAIVLYDVVERYPNHKVYDEALYYLSESLFMKGDYVASRSYFTKLVVERSTRSKFYQQALERLIELTLKLNDSENVERWLALLDAVPAAERRSSVPYVRGKYYFFNGDYDKALAQFNQVGQRSKYYFQARYFAGATLVAKKDLAKAVVEYQKLIRLVPRSAEQRKVIELSQMALGRIHYERNQPSKAIDRYLEVSRRSDLFDETMFEVAWVYVKNREFDKALRALELLALNDPMSPRLPNVKILEGNLRIRKAQRLNDANNPRAAQDEYERAVFVFQQLRGVFEKPRAELDKTIADKRDPADYLAQITGRHAETFDIKATLPEVAASWLRDEPEVGRIVGVETDLGQVEGDVQTAEKTIRRLEYALSTPSRVNIFPGLAAKRIRATEIIDDITAMRIELAGQQQRLLARYAQGEDRSKMERLGRERSELAAELRRMPDATVAESARISRARGRTVQVDKESAEASTIIGQAEAQLVAMEKFLADQGYKEVKPGDLGEMKAEIRKNRAEIQQLKKELESVKDDTIVALDRAGTGDETATRRAELRANLRAALDAEHKFMQELAARADGNDRRQADRMATYALQADRIGARLDEANAKIDGIVDEALVEVRATLEDERAKLSSYKQEYVNYDGESHALGGEVLGLAFSEVARKLYEVMMRSDVGVVDVAWSIKEGADRTLRRLTLDQAREGRLLDTEFADVVQEVREKRDRERLQQEKQQQGAQQPGADQSGPPRPRTVPGGSGAATGAKPTTGKPQGGTP